LVRIFPHSSELEDRHEEVKRLIGQRHLLLVIDDVWDIKAARALQCGGPNCCHLLTSRELGIAASFAGRERASNLPVLEDDAAYQFLQELARKPVRQILWQPASCPIRSAACRWRWSWWVVTWLPRTQPVSGAQPGCFGGDGPPGAPPGAGFRPLGRPASRRSELKTNHPVQPGDPPEEARTAFYALGAFAPKPERFSLQAAQAVTNAAVNTLALLVARNLLEIMEKAGQELAMHQTIADTARTLLPPEAVARHREYYLALVNEDREDWRQIEPVYGQVQWAWGNSPDEGDLLDWVWALRLYQTRRGLWQDQISWIERGLRVAEAQGLRQVQGTLLNNMGVVYSDTGQPQKALELYGQALPIRREVGDRAGEAATLNNMASVYSDTGQPQKALELYEQALLIRQEVGDRAGEAVTLNNMGRCTVAPGSHRKRSSCTSRL
jgi:tetratricopeptide (TPR) repeat protein